MPTEIRYRNMRRKRKQMIDFNRPAFTGREFDYIRDAVQRGMLCGDGEYTKRCSQWMMDKFHVNHVMLTTSCTHALEMAAHLCDIKPGDEVIMPSYTFVSTADAFVLKGAKIVFVDIRPDTMNIDEKLIEAAVTEKTKVIVPVHYAGVACEMDTIMEIAKKYNVPVVIDDDIYAVIESGVDGVHIGQKDMDYIEARKLLGDDKIIGMTAPSVELAKKAEKLGADYIGAGAVFNTSTKKDTKPLELSTLREICSSISIPVVAIGGIDHSNVRKLKGTDIDGVAVISALFGASDPGEATRELVSIMKDVVQ